MNSRRFKNTLLSWLVLFPLTTHASFIESTIGTAVVNDATATYFNPAALTLLKNPQIITQGSSAHFRSHFTGQSIQTGTGFTQIGNSNSQTNYFLPSLYLGIPTTGKVTIGFALISNEFTKNVEENSILRYADSNSSIQDLDLVPAIGVKLNDSISVGAGLSLSYASFLLQPLSGFPSLNIPDSQSHNESNGAGVGGDLGFLLKPTASTLIGFNYRSAITYELNGKSILASNPAIISDQYSYNFWTPARSVLSINQQVSPKLGFIATIQRIQWSIFSEIHIRGIATQIGSQSVILNATVPQHFRNTWLVTLGTHYRITPKWVIRVAGNYNQSPGNSNYQITNGDSITLGASMGYEIFKNINLDGSYARAFIQSSNIHLTTNTNTISGVNNGSLDAVSLKLTFNLC